MSVLPRITVIVVTRDRPALLADALNSVAAQTRPPLEVRLADDGGANAFEALPATPLLQITVLPVACGQAGAARNLAAAGAEGDVLAFLDDDDLWRPEHLARLARAFVDPAVGFAWSDTAVIRECVHADGRREALESRVIARDWDDAPMRSHFYLPPSALAMRRDVFAALGGFDESFRYSEDWDLVLRAAATTRGCRVPGVTVEVRLREQGNSSSVIDEERRDCLRRLADRHGLNALDPMTFWEVAAIVGGSE